MRIAVIGTGISGNLVARLLANRHEVDVFEANNHIGGHAHSVEFEAFGRRWLADIGFMVFNDRTYPNFCRLLEILGIAAQPSDMSFSVSCLRTGLEYQGSSLSGLFAQRSNLIRPRFWQMLGDIVRFHRAAVQALESGGVDDGSSVGDFLERRRFGTAFREHYLLPMTAAIWSSRPATILEFPAKFLFGFMRNHGLLQLRDRPVWKTVRGGSRAYVEQLVTPFRHRIRLSLRGAERDASPGLHRVGDGGGHSSLLRSCRVRHSRRPGTSTSQRRDQAGTEYIVRLPVSTE